MDLKILTGSFYVVDMAEKTYSDVLLWLAAGLILGAIAYLIIVQTHPAVGGVTVPAANNTTVSANSTNRTAVIDITLINAPDCPACRPLGYVVPLLVNVTQELNITIGYVANLSASEGASLISKYDITKLPALVVTGNITSAFAEGWTSSLGTQESDGALVMRNLYPPYYENGSTVGVVTGIAIAAPDCPECMNASNYFQSLEDPSVDMDFANASILQEGDNAAQTLISEYNITKLPVLLLSEDVEAYPVFNQSIQPFGEITNGWFILRNVTPPYFDVETGQVRGLVDSVLVVNSSCTNCLNATGFSQYMAQEGYVTIVNTTTYEANSTAGEALIAKYNLSALPAVLYSPEAAFYPEFTKLWLQRNSTIESDGWYVFRAYNLLGAPSAPYQNLTR
jgi:hypothetical protein